MLSADHAELKGVRILIVEDNWHVADALKLLFRAEGMEVSGPAATTAGALKLSAKDKPELAVVDMNLRGEMAYDLIDQLNDQGVRVVVVSGYAVLPRLAGVAAVLLKPLKNSELLATLRRARNPARGAQWGRIQATA